MRAIHQRKDSPPFGYSEIATGRYNNKDVSMRGYGFTLLELLVAVAVATILLTVGVPGFLQMIAANQRQTNTADVFSALNHARSEAIARNVRVVMCPSADASTCGAASWQDGWLIYANLDGNISNGGPDNDDRVLQTHGPLAGDFTLSSADFPSRIVYLPTGRATDKGGFVLCAAHSDVQGRLIEVSSTGRPRTTTHTCSGGD